MGIINDIDFKEIAKQSHKIEKELDTNEKIDEFINKYMRTDGPLPKEHLEEIKKNGLQGSFDYPDGLEQYEKDIKRSII